MVTGLYCMTGTIYPYIMVTVCSLTGGCSNIDRTLDSDIRLLRQLG